MDEHHKEKSKHTKIALAFIIIMFLVLIVLIIGDIFINVEHFKSERQQAEEILNKSQHMHNYDTFRAKGGDAVEYTILKKCKNKDQLNESCIINELK